MKSTRQLQSMFFQSKNYPKTKYRKNDQTVFAAHTDKSLVRKQRPCCGSPSSLSLNSESHLASFEVNAARVNHKTMISVSSDSSTSIISVSIWEPKATSRNHKNTLQRPNKRRLNLACNTLMTEPCLPYSSKRKTREDMVKQTNNFYQSLNSSGKVYTSTSNFISVNNLHAVSPVKITTNTSIKTKKVTQVFKTPDNLKNRNRERWIERLIEKEQQNKVKMTGRTFSSKSTISLNGKFVEAANFVKERRRNNMKEQNFMHRTFS